MRPQRIFIVRHGQSEGNFDKTIYKSKPDYALELTVLGKQQAEDAGRKIDSYINGGSIQYYVSPYWRTRQTYLGIRKSITTKESQIYFEDPRLREQEWGHLRNANLTSKMEEYRDHYGQFYYRFDDGESCADVFDRTSDFMGSMYRDFKKDNFAENVVIVSHGMTARMFLMRWFHASVEEFDRWKNPRNGDFYLLERIDAEKYKLVTPLKTHKLKHAFQFDWGNDPGHEDKLPLEKT